MADEPVPARRAAPLGPPPAVHFSHAWDAKYPRGGPAPQDGLAGPAGPVPPAPPGRSPFEPPPPSDPSSLDPERVRLAAADARREPWRAWGPYVAERAWGTVREDYSADGDAWSYFPYEQARSRVYRWNEDGMAGVCDTDQTFCFALALWNGRDDHIKERMFGLTNGQGNHGEDAKDYWWYLDSTPTHSWMRWAYHYPQRAFPYEDLTRTNGARGKDEPEYELLDTGIFDEDRYWAVTVDYAKAAPTDYCVRITVDNKGPEADTLHVLPTLWYRNTWAWTQPEPPRPVLTGTAGALRGRHPAHGEVLLVSAGGPDGASTARRTRQTDGESSTDAPSSDGSVSDGSVSDTGSVFGTVSDPVPLLCDNETDNRLLYGVPGRSEYPKDGINDHIVHGAPTVNAELTGTKGALHHAVSLPPGGRAEIRLRLVGRPPAPTARRTTAGRATASRAAAAPDLGSGWERVMAAREHEADVFHASLVPAGASADEALILRQAYAGLLWSKQFYHYDLARWLGGDPGQPPPPEGRPGVRNGSWTHLHNHDILLMPDSWEYPWFAAWDLAFHCVVMARVDPAFAKEQLTLLLREWYLHPSGQLPAYEWNFSDVNPPVHAWAALRVFEIDGGTDLRFLARVFHKLLMNFTWWVNRKDREGSNVFEGGFLGLDNIGVFDRSHLPVAGELEQSDGTAWMALYCLDLLRMALVLAAADLPYEDVASKFFEHYAYISAALVDSGLWNEEDGFFYDLLRSPDGRSMPLRARSMVGLIPLCAVLPLHAKDLEAVPHFAERMDWFLEHRKEFTHGVDFGKPTSAGDRLLSVVDSEQLERLLGHLFDEREFLSSHGLRALSAHHRDHPLSVRIDGTEAGVDYEPGESRTGMFGGNSNWRGPVWFPLNVLLVEALDAFGELLDGSFTVEYPTGSGRRMTLTEAADDVRDRLIGIFRRGADGRRPVFGTQERMQRDPAWRDRILFHEYFHGDSGVGLGASHQTGWTALVAELIQRRRAG